MCHQRHYIWILLGYLQTMCTFVANWKMMTYKNILYFFLLLIIVPLGCDNDLNLLSDFQEIPVVYAILDPADSVQYFRVERVFADESVSPIEIAQNPDSLYYKDAVVQLKRLKTGKLYPLEMVDGDKEGIPRDTGAFAKSPNYLYKLKTEDIPLVDGEEYELVIDGIFEDRSITAKTKLVTPSHFTFPQDDGLISMDPFDKKINQAWNPKGEGDRSFSVTYIIYIREEKNGDSKDMVLRWNVEKFTSKTKLEALRGDFFSFIAGQLQKDPAIKRKLLKVDYEFITVGDPLTTYINVGQANLGITSSGEIPVFTNLSEGIGIFGAKYTDIRSNLQLTNSSRDSLLHSTITRAYNFY